MESERPSKKKSGNRTWTVDCGSGVRKLVDRVRNIQKNAIGDGINQCILCGDYSSIWSGTSHVTCKDCRKVSVPAKRKTNKHTTP